MKHVYSIRKDEGDLSNDNPIMLMKRIIFFDGDGTLWYPKTTKYKKEPHWVYKSPQTNQNPNHHLTLTPSMLTTIKRLRAQGIILIILSTHPHPPQEADIIINNKIRHFKLEDLFDEVHATRDRQESKGEFMIDILDRRNIPKNQALMVGDSYDWDYKPAKDNGIDALLIDSDYRKNHHKGKRIRRTIQKLSEIFTYL